jgi:subtilisin-like proprotein convertase family protein
MTLLIRTQLRKVMMATAVMALVSVPAAFADIAVQDQGTNVQEIAGNGNGTPEPGDTIAITETVATFNDDLMNLTGVTGTLSSSNPDVTFPSATSPYPDLLWAYPTSNTNPYSVKLGSSMECGVNVPLNLTMQTSLGSGDIGLSLPTGSAGAFAGYDSQEVPRAIPDNESLGVSSTLTIGGTGRVKGLKVRIGSITHTYDGDLTIALIAPDGRSVTLVSHAGGNGVNFANTVFDDNAATRISDGSAPFTGTYRPAGLLSSLDGEPLAGTWTLKVTDTSAGSFGTLDAWGMDVAPAVCAPQPTSGPPDPTPTPPPHDCGQHNGGVVPSLSKAKDNGKGDKPAKDKPCKN